MTAFACFGFVPEAQSAPDLTSNVITLTKYDSSKGVNATSIEYEIQPGSNVGFVTDFSDAADSVNNTTWIYDNAASTSNVLTVNIGTEETPATFLIPGASNSFLPNVSQYNSANQPYNLYRFYIAAGLRTVATNDASVKIPFGWEVFNGVNGAPDYVALDGKTYYLAADYSADQPALNHNLYFSDSANNHNLIININKGSAISAKLHGSRNDLYGPGSASDDSLIGVANNNSVTINFADNAFLFSQIVFGGRSAQKEGVKSYTGYATDQNFVVLQGSSLRGKKLSQINGAALQADMAIRAGIWGAEGWQTNRNYVKISDATIVGQDDTKLHWGIIGGRGYFHNRLNLDATGGQSSIADGNVVIIRNSRIGFANEYASSAKQEGSPDLSKVGSASINVFGGYSVGTAKNNLVVIEDAQIRGNVFGGFELQNKLKGSAETPEGIRNLNPNLVSLHNVSIAEGFSFYGSATADLYQGTLQLNNTKQGVYNNEDNNHDWLENGQYAFNESNLYPVNRRRGVAYLAGKVESDSAYVRCIHFGQYFDSTASVLTSHEDIGIAKTYYPHVAGQANLPQSNDDAGIVRITDANNNGEGIQLGTLVGGSYLLNRKGFHSDLSPEKGSNQSETTNGLHNFWVASYVNLLGKVEGSGTSLNVTSSLFGKDGAVKHDYAGGSLALATLDDGFILSGDSSSSWMERFRSNYTNKTGRVLYLGVNDGKNNLAVNIDYQKIDEFRNKTTNQSTNAHGNTQIGIWVNGQGEDAIGNPFRKAPSDSESSWNDLVIHVPGFAIEQGNGNVVAQATFGFYKYLHFDGKYDSSTQIQSTDNGEEGGLGLKYWLESLSLAAGKNLIIYGKNDNATFASGKENPDTYTLSAYLTGSGGITVPDNNTVVIGDPRQPVLAEVISGPGANQSKIGENQFTGKTLVESNAHLIQGSDGALGSEAIHTQELLLSGQQSSYHLLGHEQVIGALNVEAGAEVHFTNTDEELGKLIKAEVGSGPQVLKSSDTSDGKERGHDGFLKVTQGATVDGNLFGTLKSELHIAGNDIAINSNNEKFGGTIFLEKAISYLGNPEALKAANVDVSQGSSLYINTSRPEVSQRISSSPYSGEAYLRGVINAGDVFLSNERGNGSSGVNDLILSGNYEGKDGSVLHYRGLLQGDDNSSVDVVHVAGTSSGSSKVDFQPFLESRGEKTETGVLIFATAKVDPAGQNLELMSEPRIIDKDDEAYEWRYWLEAKDGEDGSRNWYLVNEKPTEINPKPDVPVTPVDPVDPDTPDVPVIPADPVLRPEAGAYVGASQSWGKMHMRLHDRFGQAYYIDPFSGEEKPAAAWVRQVGSHSHFKMNGGESKSHSRTAVTQLGGDVIRNEFNEDWKYIGGVFAGGLYNRTNSKSYASAKSRSDGYALGIYGTLYTGNSPDDGFYVDSWLMFGRYDNKVWGDQRPTFKYKSHGWVWSVESGYTIPIGESGTKDYNKVIWTFQPEVQFVWDGVRANSVTDATGTRYSQLGKDNVTIRAGARVHANYMNKGLGFIEANWIHNTKRPGVEMGNGKVYMDGGKNLGEFRMGMEGHITKNTLGWATVGVQAGKSGYHNETAQIGIKYMF